MRLRTFEQLEVYKHLTQEQIKEIRQEVIKHIQELEKEYKYDSSQSLKDFFNIKKNKR